MNSSYLAIPIDGLFPVLERHFKMHNETKLLGEKNPAVKRINDETGLSIVKKLQEGYRRLLTEENFSFIKEEIISERLGELETEIEILESNSIKSKEES